MKTLLIRAEDKNRWERRSTIVPADLKQIIKKSGVTVYIEKSDKRYFSEQEFIEAGAKPCIGMESGDVIFGVKEIPEEKIIENKTYLFFSHTIKGQKENMSMLKRLMDSGSTLIDYEKITDEQGRRKVFFGPFAGDAGAIDILWLLGENWKDRGINTPFAKVKQALHYDSVQDAKNKLSELGKELELNGFPEQAGPVFIGILGYGNVSRGAQQIFEQFPHKYITPEELPAFAESGKASLNKIYLTVFKEEHLVEHNEKQPFVLQDYYDHPEDYHSVFQNYLPYFTLLVNATYWTKAYPTFVSWDALSTLSAAQEKPKLKAIADITCDPNGSVECTVKCTDSGMPAFRVFPREKKSEDGHLGDGIIVLAVDNLPAEVPRDASEFFSRSLSPFVPGIMQADFNKPLDECGLPPEIKRAVIVYKGKLTPDFSYLQQYVS